MTIVLTKAQAQCALTCIEESISYSEFDTQEYENLETLRFYLQRAETKERLQRVLQLNENSEEKI